MSIRTCTALIPLVCAQAVPATALRPALSRAKPFGTSIREGFFNVLTDHVERITGRRPRTLRSVLEQFLPTWPR